MSSSKRNCIVGLALLGFALIWSAFVYWTIPAEGQQQQLGAVGPRAFPLLLGIVLAGLSALMVIRSFQERNEEQIQEVTEDAQPAVSWLEIRIAGGLFLLLLLYGFLLEKIGFLLATPIIVIGAVVGLLDVKRPVLILSMAAGIAVGSWLIFNKLLGAYLPLGSWVSLG